jgi:chloramphenicol 3-O phosphotransferase
VVDGTDGDDKDPAMAGSLIILNGASSSGKTSIGIALQRLWPRPLLVTGIDAVIAGWPESYITAPSEEGGPAGPTTGMRIVPGRGPSPSWILELGPDFHAVMALVHRSWESLSRGGIDLVIDHVILDSTLRSQAEETLADAFWVGVTCDVEELVRRELERGDRYLGFASGSSAVVHQEMTYDLVIDSTHVPPDVLAREILDSVTRWTDRHRKPGA